MSYRRILGTTVIMGGTSIVNTLLGMIRTKVLALLLGPTGIGLAGAYGGVLGLVGTICGFGIGESGVRQIAGAVGSGDNEKVARTLKTVRRTALISGFIGFLALLFFNGTASRFTFGTSEHGFDLAILSITLLFGAVSSGQTALIQGFRRIGDLAKLSILEALLAVVFSVPIIYIMGRRGIPFFLFAVSATAILSTWWYARKIKIPEVKVTWSDSLREARPLLRLGSALMAGILVINFTQYLLRVIIIRGYGLDAAGIYQSATNLSLVYVSIILNAMLTDFYPRLSEAADNTEECTLLINKQIEVGLLLAVPGILAVITCAPYVISIFYSSKFMLAVNILRWQILGVMLQVVSWPIGFILRAKADGKLFFLTELFAGVTQLSLAFLGLKFLGLPGAGAALFGMNLLYLVLIYVLARKKYAFRFTSITSRLFAVFTAALGSVSIMRFFLSHTGNLIFDIIITIVISGFALKVLINRTRQEKTMTLSPKMRSSLVS